jgi:hypothetical protein
VGSTFDSAIVQEHGALLASAVAVMDDLRDFRSHIRFSKVWYAQYTDFAERALSLYYYFSASLDSALANNYLAAFAVLRSALEQHLADRLLFLARHYRQELPDQQWEAYEQLVERWKKKVAGTEDIRKVQWHGRSHKPGAKGRISIVRTGLHPEGGKKGPSGRTMSIYYFLLKEFDPFVGPPQHQPHLARGFTPVELHTKRAGRQRTIYRGNLSWDAIKQNLTFNHLTSAETLRRLDVHYRFLSAFVHPVPAAFDEAYGRDEKTSSRFVYDHYSSELVLLYINKIAAAELKALARMSSRRPKVRLGDWDTVERHIKTADSTAAHLWFPGDPPHPFDRVQEANSRGLRRDKFVDRDKRPTPDQLKTSQIRYYKKPLRRLIEMHRSVSEMTGFTYVSPWPRPWDPRR